MAVEKIDQSWAAPASADLSAKQYTLVKLTETGELAAAGAGDNAFVLVTKPKSGRPGTIVLDGVTKAICGAAVKAGEYLSSDANGKVVPATVTKVESEKVKTTGTHIVGQALEKAAENELVTFYTARGLA